MKSPLRYVGFRLFFVLMGVMLVAFTIHTYVDIRTSSSNLTNSVYASAQRSSDLIARSTRHGMLLNRKEDVHEIIRTLGNEPGVVGISVYNKEGEIIFSSDTPSIGKKVDLAAEACHICHATGEPLVSVPSSNRMRVYAADGQRILGLINPIRNEPACSEAACHAHDADQNVLGVLDVKMSLASVDLQVAAVRRRLIVSSLVIALLTAGLSGAFIYRVVRRPILRLEQGMARVSRGDLDTKIEVSWNNELGDLADAFNDMAGDLRRAREEIGRWTGTLEQRVQEKAEELERAQSQVIHMEKMASLGKLSASVAHEINNPLFGILTYSKLGLRELEDSHADPEKLREYLTIVQRESGRCGDIVRNLLQFARNTPGEFASQHLNTLVSQVVTLLAHHFDMRQVEVQSDLNLQDDELVCDAKKIQQALIAPCINAVEAMPDGGRLTLKTSGDANEVRIHIEDTGSGMDPEVLAHVFEPFYTTKEEAGGLGLGLSVVYGIVRLHGGRVDIDSRPGRGTAITIALPREPKRDSAEELSVQVGGSSKKAEERGNRDE